MKKKHLTAIFLLATLFLGHVALAEPGRAKLAADLVAEMDRGAPQSRVIVLYDREIGDDQLESVRGRGGIVHKKLDGVRGLSGTLSRQELEALATDPQVVSISPDRVVRGSMDISVPTIGADHLTEVFGYTGEGITVALIDSGLTPSAAVSANRIRTSRDFTGTGRAGRDGFGHGTHVAGIIGGSGKNGSVRGVAPGVDFVSLKVLDDEGAGYVSDVIEAIDFAIEHRFEFGIRILNLSLGHPVMESYRTDPLTRAVEKAWAAGLAVIVSAGNHGRDGYMTISSPGNDPYVLTVGAMNDLDTEARADDIITTYSGRGPSIGDHVVKPDLVAPGNRLVSTLAHGATLADTFPERVVGDDRLELSGTSMAAGVVSGTTALLLQRHPFLTNDQVKVILMVAAEKRGDDDVFAVGAGYLNAVAATAATGPYEPIYFNSSSPLVERFDDGSYVIYGADGLSDRTDVRSDAAPWGDSAIWGDSAVWGDSAIWGDTALWSDSAVWGDNALWGDAALWGDSAVWGDTALWSDSAIWGDAALWGDSAIWGDTALWSDSAVWGDSAIWGDTALWSDSAIWGDTALWSDSAVWGDTALWSDSAIWGDTALWSDSAVWGDTALWSDSAIWGDSVLGNGD